MKISRLFYYPIKSLQGVEVNELPLDKFGAVNDRRFMLVDDSGKFVTQRQYPQLALVRVNDVEAGHQIHIPDVGDFFLPLQGREDVSKQVTVWNDSFTAFIQPEWTERFTQFLGVSTQLVYLSDNTERLIDKNFCDDGRVVSFADGFPLLFCTESSLNFLNERMQEPITIERFRPNVVISDSEAFAENAWENLVVNDNVFAAVKPCSRCVIPTINPESSDRQSFVFKALQQFCKGDDGQVYFGQNVVHSIRATQIVVGASVELANVSTEKQR